jgi:ubiquinone/menaquinone biosynthesis C-methylase UbiE
MNGVKMENYFKIMKPASKEWNKQFVKWVHEKYFDKPGELIDLGCGQGEIIEEFKKLGYRVKGVDFPIVDLEKKLPFKNNIYDYVVCKFVFEHIMNINGLIFEIYRILKPGGKVIVLTDNAVIDLEGFLEDPTHKTLFSLKRLKNLALLNNLKIIDLRKWRNIPYIWRYTLKAFDFTFPFSKQIIGVFKKQ